eukprot:TRINITY_DN5605_c0_g1_i1.p1 TRINITY_DN5605_c0_g1~~TRINITY_DN5605_c0_g1_i1.p1  ORF type:complete len:467 (-),score=88.56 TRINITY_DN5605_c0_g1_i1:834-2150(-)
MANASGQADDSWDEFDEGPHLGGKAPPPDMTHGRSRGHPISVDDDVPPPASVYSSIATSNKGFQMMLKMGWSENTGLGRDKQGIVAPIDAGSKADRLGLGKQAQDDFFAENAASQRKLLDGEAMETESQERKAERAARVAEIEQREAIQQEIMSVFFCEMCDKQYKNISQYEQHLDSYDHQHKKRLREYQDLVKPETKSQVAKRERAREEKALQKLISAANKKNKPECTSPASAAATAPAATSAAATVPLPPSFPPGLRIPPPPPGFIPPLLATTTPVPSAGAAPLLPPQGPHAFAIPPRGMPPGFIPPPPPGYKPPPNATFAPAVPLPPPSAMNPTASSQRYPQTTVPRHLPPGLPPGFGPTAPRSVVTPPVVALQRLVQQTAPVLAAVPSFAAAKEQSKPIAATEAPLVIPGSTGIKLSLSKKLDPKPRQVVNIDE